MDIAKKYRTSLEFREILRIFQRTTMLSDNLIWQTDRFGKKNIIPIDYIEIDFITRGVAVFYNPNLYKLDLHSPLYVKLDYKTSVFKIFSFSVDRSSILFSFPVEIRTLELRSSKRYALSSNSGKEVILRPAIIEDHLLLHQVSATVIDISLGGMGLLVPETFYHFFKTNRILWITQIGGHRGGGPILSEVRYLNNDFDSHLYRQKQKFFKVGLKLSTALSPNMLSTFIH
jgi:hypothetical protein